MFIYFCQGCKKLEVIKSKTGSFKCPICGKDYLPLQVTVDEWNGFSNEQMLDAIERAKQTVTKLVEIKTPVFKDTEPSPKQIGSFYQQEDNYGFEDEYYDGEETFEPKKPRKTKKTGIIAIITIIVIILASIGVGLFFLIGKGKDIDDTKSAKLEDAPDNVKLVQHKIDKALESEPSYQDYAEIKNLYEDLLKAEQEMIENYDQIESQFCLSEKEVACIFSAQLLKGMLKAPDSLQITDVQCASYKNDGGLLIPIVLIKYSATNGFGGTVTDTFYCCLDNMPSYDEANDEWSCELQLLYKMKIQYEAKYGYPHQSSAQEYGRDEFNACTEKENVDPTVIMENINMKIKDVSGPGYDAM